MTKKNDDDPGHFKNASDVESFTIEECKRLIEKIDKIFADLDKDVTSFKVVEEFQEDEDEGDEHNSFHEYRTEDDLNAEELLSKLEEGLKNGDVYIKGKNKKIH